MSHYQQIPFQADIRFEFIAEEWFIPIQPDQYGLQTAKAIQDYIA